MDHKTKRLDHRHSQRTQECVTSFGAAPVEVIPYYIIIPKKRFCQTIFVLPPRTSGSSAVCPVQHETSSRRLRPAPASSRRPRHNPRHLGGCATIPRHLGDKPSGLAVRDPGVPEKSQIFWGGLRGHRCRRHWGGRIAGLRKRAVPFNNRRHLGALNEVKGGKRSPVIEGRAPGHGPAGRDRAPSPRQITPPKKAKTADKSAIIVVDTY